MAAIITFTRLAWRIICVFLNPEKRISKTNAKFVKKLSYPA
jgi:phage terminase large subunit-like protein